MGFGEQAAHPHPILLGVPAPQGFHENSPYGKIPAKKEPTRTLGFTSKTTLPRDNINNLLKILNPNSGMQAI